VKIAIIGGSGKMGQWFANFLSKPGAEVIITGRNQQKLHQASRQLGGVKTATNIEATKQSDVIIISVPIDNFEAVIQQIQPHINAHHTVLDVTSVKTLPVKIMHQYIKTGTVLGTHPVFGPGARDLTNQSVVLTPTSESETALARKIKAKLESNGARVSLMTPQQHDEMMVVILGLAHFIGIVSADILSSFDGLNQLEAIGGTTYKLLLTLAESVISEDPEIYASLQMNLPDVTKVEKGFQSRVSDWANLVENKDKKEFVRRMTAVKARLEESDPNFQKAYQKMYRILDILG